MQELWFRYFPYLSPKESADLLELCCLGVERNLTVTNEDNKIKCSANMTM